MRGRSPRIGAKMTSIGSLHLREAGRTFVTGVRANALRYAPLSGLRIRSTSLLMYFRKGHEVTGHTLPVVVAVPFFRFITTPL